MGGYFGVGLDNPKTDINVGAALRAVGAYGGSFIAASGGRFKPGNTDTMKQYRRVPLFRPANLFEVLPYDCVPVAVDLVDDAECIFDYKHPERAFYIFGAEDTTLGERVLSRCRDKIYIPTNGCMNLAACVNVVLYDRAMKISKAQSVDNKK